MELQVLRASTIDTIVTTGTSLAASPRIEIESIVRIVAPMAAITIVHLVQNGFNFKIEPTQIVAEGWKDTDQHKARQIKWELDHLIQDLLIVIVLYISTALVNMVVRWLEAHKNEAKGAEEADKEERGEEECFEFQTLQCEGLLLSKLILWPSYI